MRKTKMICGIGPATHDWEVFEKLVNNGLNVVRVNFSHATMEERARDEELAKMAREKLGKDVAVLFDTKGPDLRTGMFENNLIEFKAGNTIRIVKEEVEGNAERICFNYPQVIDNLKVGTQILLNDGFVRLDVISVEKDGVTCKILDDAPLKSRRGVNIPGVELNIPFVSEDDEADIKYACEHDGDFLGISFVSTADDVRAARDLLKKYGKPNMPILSRLPSPKNFALSAISFNGFIMLHFPLYFSRNHFSAFANFSLHSLETSLMFQVPIFPAIYILFIVLLFICYYLLYFLYFHYKSEAEREGKNGQIAAETKGGTAAPRKAAPRATTIHTVRARRMSLRICLCVT